MTGPVEWLLRRITGRPKRVPDPHRIEQLERLEEVELWAERAHRYRDEAFAAYAEYVRLQQGSLR